SYKLEDVWVGTYRIKVNLSRYGRKGSKPLGAQDKRHGVGSSSGVQDKHHGVGSSGGNHALVDKSFRSALVGDMIVPVSNQHGDSQVVVTDIPILETDVE
ncbi:hypothetical protein A2U01_0066946, partial [Trifolium medium]|nr:hypothetical protein [Trifolium medium]